MSIIPKIQTRLKREYNLILNQDRVKKVLLPIAYNTQLIQSRPVLFYNASTRLSGLSLNAGFSLVTSLALAQIGIPVVHFVCRRGMSHCVLGTNRDAIQDAPPCRECIRTSGLIFQGAAVEEYGFSQDKKLEEKIKGLSLQELLSFEYREFSIGQTILPSLRWILRRHHLVDDEETRYLAQEYILSAWNIKRRFVEVLIKRNPRAVVVFNGMFYPESVVRQTAREWGIPVFSHEVGMQPMSAFFTDKEATAYPVKVDVDFLLNEEQNLKLQGVLEKRFQGKFETAGVEFWPEMQGVKVSFEKKIQEFDYLVPVFTNVIFDTSQTHANLLFNHMFEWLDLIVEYADKFPKTLFIIRAHPDETRPGKESRESVKMWVKEKKILKRENVVFISPDEYISSYDLVRRAKFVMVYNSTIGLEASMMGKPVLCAGKARYTQIPTVFFPDSIRDFEKLFLEFLEKKKIHPQKNHQENARRVFYSQYFRASLPFNEFLEEDSVWRGYVRLKDFKPKDLSPDNSPVMKTLIDGILEEKSFIRDL